MLVVGASATGIQLADEIHRSGRPVTLAVGEHVRVPRIYRGRDIQWWMDAAGVLDERYDEVDDIVRARSLPSLQLVGSPERDDARPQCAHRHRREARRPPRRHPRRQGAVLGLAAQSVRAGRPQDGPAARHDRRMGDRERARRRGRPAASLRADQGRGIAAARHGSHAAARSGRSSGRPASGPTTPGSTCRSSIARARSGTTAASSRRPGMYLMGMPFLRRRKSSLIDGAGDDARDLSDHLKALSMVLDAGVVWTFRDGGLAPVRCGYLRIRTVVARIFRDRFVRTVLGVLGWAARRRSGLRTRA